ncbi:MAG: ABC transporter ATP-binding protein [Proteobacteria bacterium]|nr:ABC transporter ATP-binding protein [Pseudomonadota bacterium]
MKKLVEVIGLTKEFNGTRAVDGISFEIYEGEVLGLLGANGAGKTTTLQMLLGLTTPTDGAVKLFGLDMKDSREEILKRVNFSSSYVSLPFSLTVYENLQVFAMLYEIKNRKSKILDMLRVFEIEDLKHKPVRRLSSGQITRVCLAKSLLNDPEVLFLDEPTASLDPDIADKTRRLLKDITKDRGVAILYTSHNMKEMEEICDRVIFMDRGHIAAIGTLAEIKEKYKTDDLEEVFLRIARKTG